MLVAGAPQRRLSHASRGLWLLRRRNTRVYDLALRNDFVRGAGSTGAAAEQAPP
jgi:hypothetical protein